MTLFKYLLLALLTGNVVLKLFTNYLNLIPRVFNVIDVFIVGAMFFLFLIFPKKQKKIKFKKLVFLLFVFNLILLIGTILNPEYFYLPASLSQVVMLNEPILLFLILTHLPFSLRDLNQFQKLLFGLIIIEFLIGWIQAPLVIFTGAGSETIMGTFHHNAEQFVGFMIIGFLFFLGKMTGGLIANKNYYILLLLGFIVLIVLIETKASWVSTALTILFAYSIIFQLKRNILIKAFYGLIAFSIMFIGYQLIKDTGRTLYKYGALWESVQDGQIFEFGKLKAYEDIFTSFQEYPHMKFVGSGPATFYSRASRTFYEINPEKYGYNSEKYRYNSDKIISDQKKKYKTSDSMGGVVTKQRNEPFFMQYLSKWILNPEIRLGTDGTDSPFSSYSSILGETGVLGFICYFGIYIIVFLKMYKQIKRHRKNKLVFPIWLAGLGFLFYSMVVGLYNPWLETSRMTTILWSIIALCFKYEEQLSIQKINFLNLIRHQQKPDPSTIQQIFTSSKL